MPDNVTRRELLRKSGIALAVGAVGTGQVAAADADPRPEPVAGTLPTEKGNTSEVAPFSIYDEADTGDWIIHDLGWKFKPAIDEGGAEIAKEFVHETTSVAVEIAGERIEDPEQYWDEPTVADEEGYGTQIHWTYETPPKEPGDYYFNWWTFNQEGDPLWGVFPVGQYYTVSEGRSKK